MNKVINTDLTEVQKTALQDWLRAEYTDLPLMLNSFFERVKTHQIDFEDSGENQHLAQEVRNSIQRIKEELKILLNTEKDGSIVVKSSLIQIFDAHLCFEYRRIFPLISKTEIQFVNCEFSTTKEDLPIGWEGSGRVFEKRLFFHDCTFGDFISFSSSIFKEVVEFNNSTFMNSCDFHECTFEKNACFYGVDFKGVPNFSQANFLQKINLINTNLNFSFEECKKLVESEKERRINQRANTIKMGKPITGAQIANDFRDSFEVLKSKFIDIHDEYEAEKYHQMMLFFKEIELEEYGEKIEFPYFLKKVSAYFSGLSGFFRRLDLWCVKQIFPDQFPIFIEQKYLAFCRQVHGHRINEIKIFNIFILITVFHFFIIQVALFLARFYLIEGTQKDVDLVATFLWYSLLTWVVAPIFHCIISKVKTKMHLQLITLIIICVVLVWAFNVIFLALSIKWLIVLLSVGTVTLYFVCFYVLFILLKSKFIKYITYATIYISLVFTLVINPNILYPILGKFEESKMENKLLDDYIQNSSTEQLGGIIKRCHVLNQKIDWGHDQYEQIRKIMLNNSEVFLIDTSCSSQINNNFLILILKNKILGNAIRVVNTIYFIFAALLLFILGRVASRRLDG